MLKDSNVISLQISTADIMQQIVWVGSSSIRTVRTFVPERGTPGILGVRITPHVIIREEFLHDSFVLPSHHLNVAVIVQDKGRTGPASELRAVGKAVLDTANYSEDLISFTMLEKLNATGGLIMALQAITVCSGLDGQC